MTTDDKRVAQGADAVRAYLKSEEKANPDDYAVEFAREYGGYLVFNAVHRDDRKPDATVVPGGGSGKSREVRVDPATMRVAASLAWQ